MLDPFGRSITYLRLSVTDRCNLRCVYCMSDDITFMPRNELLSLEELDKLASVFMDLGTRRIRLTGGEPLVRRDILALIRSLGASVRDGRLDEVTLTTNGTLLTHYAEAIADAGVRRINVSLDSLNAERFAVLTRGGRLDPVLAGINAAKQAGLAVKINAVALKGVNEDEIDTLVEWCGAEGFDLSLIETMPLGEDGDRTAHYLPLDLVRQRLNARWTLTETSYQTGGPARYEVVRETGRRIGFITPLTHNFCDTCNRLRVTCTGTMYLCLGQEDSVDLKEPLRLRPDSTDLVRQAIIAAVARKPKGHDFIIDHAHPQPALSRPMSLTGG